MIQIFQSSVTAPVCSLTSHGASSNPIATSSNKCLPNSNQYQDA